MPDGDYEAVIRYSICTGEQVICARDIKTGRLIELMLAISPEDIEGFCVANGIAGTNVRKIY